jgi:hypothetical protein
MERRQISRIGEAAADNVVIHLECFILLIRNGGVGRPGRRLTSI